jgi:hypothetical protein
MYGKTAKEIMRPLKECAVVPDHATLAEAILLLEQAQDRLPEGRQLHRAVLIQDEKGKIVGKLGYLGFLKALEPKYSNIGDVERLSRAGVGAELMNLIMDNYRFWQDDLESVRRRARNIKVRDVMVPIEDSIDVDCTVTEAMHHLIMKQSLSVVVMMKGEAVGMLRLSDLFDEVAEFIKSPGDDD